MTRTGMTGRCGTGLPPAALRGENRMDERHLNRLYEDMEILEGGNAHAGGADQSRDGSPDCLVQKKREGASLAGIADALSCLDF